MGDGIKPALNLRGQKVDRIPKPTTSVYARFLDAEVKALFGPKR
jgi:hypothetical protein